MSCETSSPILGQVVTWNHFADGKPTKVLSGEVVSVSPGIPYRFLLKKFDGTFETVDASNVRVVSPGMPIEMPKHIKDGIGDLAAKIVELDLLDEVDGLPTLPAASQLLEQMLGELKEAGETIVNLTRELNELKEKSKKSPGRPRKDP